MRLHHIRQYKESCIDMNNFNYKRLEMLIHFHEYKIKDVANLTGISLSTLYKMKSEGYQPKMKIVLKLCTLFDVKPNHFYIKNIKRTYIETEDK